MIRTLTLAALPAALLLGACAAVPSVNRESAMLTPREIADMGLICRTDTPPDSNIPQTTCASQKAWGDYDKKTQRATEEMLEENRKLPNAGFFGRN